MQGSITHSLGVLPQPLQWLALVACAGALGQLLQWAQLPAALFLGPMLVAIGFGAGGATVRMPRALFRFGQGCVGLLVAHSITWSVLVALGQSWQVMLFATAVTLCISAMVGFGLARSGGLPGAVAAWGTAPGAASAMVAMAEEQGVDGRVVATLQYVRVVCVVMVGALVGHLIGAPSSGGQVQAAAWQLDLDSLRNLGLSAAVVLVGIVGANWVPAGALLIPLLLGGALQLSAVMQVHLPAEVLALAYGAMGCYIGLRFDRPTLAYVWRQLPTMISSALMLIVLCALLAGGLAYWLDKDFLSLYLATSPGGLDAMAIIAVDTHSDVGLVLAMQTLRLVGVIFTGAFFARQIMRLSR